VHTVTSPTQNPTSSARGTTCLD